MTSWLARLLGWEAEIPAGELEAVLAYLAKEWRLKALQDLEAERYNNAVTKYGGAMIPGSAGLAELLDDFHRWRMSWFGVTQTCSLCPMRQAACISPGRSFTRATKSGLQLRLLPWRGTRSEPCPIR